MTTHRTGSSRAAAATATLVVIASAALAAAGSPVAASPHVTGAASAAAHLPVRGDLDGDGKRDVVLGAPGGDRVQVRYTHASPGGSKVQWLALPASDPSYGNAYFGGTLAAADFDGDGFTDLAVGAPGWTNPVTVGNNRETQGALYLYFGSPTGLHAGDSIHGPYDGEDPFALATMMTAADVDGDGFADLALKLEGNDTDQIEIYYGAATGPDLGTAPQTFTDFGAASMAFGDVNGNGHPDLVLGDDVDLGNPVDENFGAVQVFYGTATGLTATGHQKIRGDKLGVRIGLGESTTAGDINHDGFEDVVLGDPAASMFPNHLSPGKLVVLYGGAQGLKAKRHVTIDEKKSHITRHTHTHDLFGWSIALGRITGDKYPDLLVGAPGFHVKGHHDAGAVFVLRGSKHGLVTTHVQRLTQADKGVPGKPKANSGFGAAVHLATLNADRYADAIIGAPDASSPAHHGGFAAILRGGRHGLRTRHSQHVGDGAAGDLLATAIAG